ncbi:MAG: pentapeptide repeat-containing protein [Cyclobacteriaceae bacterium]
MAKIQTTQIRSAYDGSVLFEAPGQFAEVFLTAIEKNIDLKGIDVSNQDLSNVDISEAALKRSTPLSFEGGIFNNANLTNSTIVNADLTNVSFIKAEAPGMNLLDCKMSDVNMSSIHAPGMRIKAKDITECQFTEAKIQGAHFDVDFWRDVFFTADLQGASFKPKSRMNNVDFGLSLLTNVNISQVQFEQSCLGTGTQTVEKLNARGAKFKNCNIGYTEYLKCDFSYCQFTENTKISTTNFKKCNLNFVHMDGAQVTKLHLRESSCIAADITAKWVNSSFTNSDISDTDFNYTDLTQNKFENVSADGTKFGKSDLSQSVIQNCKWESAIMREALGTKVVLLDSKLPYNQLKVTQEPIVKLSPRLLVSDLPPGIEKVVRLGSREFSN